jgi:hypothetical protein
MPTLGAAGYENTHTENAWGGSQYGFGVGWCIRDGLTRRSLWNLGQIDANLMMVPDIYWLDLDVEGALTDITASVQR